VAETVFDVAFSLPSSSSLTQAQRERVMAALSAFLDGVWPA
jgi:hypothetical protein